MSNPDGKFYDLAPIIDEAFNNQDYFPKKLPFDTKQASERVYNYITDNKSTLLKKYKNLQNLFNNSDNFYNIIAHNTAASIEKYTQGKKASNYFYIEKYDDSKPKKTLYLIVYYRE